VIAPTSGQVNPPTGVLRAAAKGAFDTSRRPIPEPKEPPRYAGDLSLDELASYGSDDTSVVLGVTEPSYDDQRPTLEIEVPAGLLGLGEPSSSTSHSGTDTLPGPPLPAGEDGAERETPQEAEDEFEPIGVKVSQPVQESGLWRGADKRGSDEGTSTPPRSYAMVAAVIVLIALMAVAYGLSGNDEPSPPVPGKGRTSKETSPRTEPRLSPRIEEHLKSGGQEGPLVGPASVDERLASAERLLERGRRTDAHQEIDTVLATHPANSRALVLRAHLFIEERKLDDALEAALAAVDSDPELADGHLALGVVRQERGDEPEAAAAYERFLELAPSSKLAPIIKHELRKLEDALGEAPP
jgi:hypothetical protein